jgi:hypothetical protein
MLVIGSNQSAISSDFNSINPRESSTRFKYVMTGQLCIRARWCLHRVHMPASQITSPLSSSASTPSSIADCTEITQRSERRPSRLHAGTRSVRHGWRAVCHNLFRMTWFTGKQPQLLLVEAPYLSDPLKWHGCATSSFKCGTVLHRDTQILCSKNTLPHNVSRDYSNLYKPPGRTRATRGGSVVHGLNFNWQKSTARFCSTCHTGTTHSAEIEGTKPPLNVNIFTAFGRKDDTSCNHCRVPASHGSDFTAIHREFAGNGQTCASCHRGGVGIKAGELVQALDFVKAQVSLSENSEDASAFGHKLPNHFCAYCPATQDNFWDIKIR